MNVKEKPYKMKCPACKIVFGLTDKQRWDNWSFVCPTCKQHIKGSTEEKNGILIGIE